MRNLVARLVRWFVMHPELAGRDGYELVYTPGGPRRGRTVWILSYTPVSNEPRVLRQAAAFRDAGWRVVVFGFDGHSPRPPEWHYVRLPGEQPFRMRFRYVLRAVREVAQVALWAIPIAPVRTLAARTYHAAHPMYLWNRLSIRRFARDYPQLRPDLVISHDYFTADAGYDAAVLGRAKFAVDCHEYARGQYMHDRGWVRTMRPYVRAFQDRYLAKADAVTTVCDGIRDLLNQEQQLKRPVRTIRSVPFRNVQPFRPTGETITVMYLGEIYYMRGLHKAIKSMPLWRPEFRFVMQGNVEPGYGERLMEIATELGVRDRVEIRPPVPFHDIVPSANRIADIGYFVHKDLSPQKRFVLPNKYFEYVMAGLALCVSDLPEMARLVHQYGFGKLVPAYDEQAIADVINSFDRATIDDMKRRSLAAAEELNWESEGQRMLEFYEEVLQ